MARRKGLEDDSFERVWLQGKELDARIDKALIEGGSFRMSIVEADSVTLRVNDPDRDLIQSDILNKKVTLNLDDLLFRYVGYRKTGDDLELTFENALVSILRGLRGPIRRRPNQTTRPDFARYLISKVPRASFRGVEGEPNLEPLVVGKREHFYKALSEIANERQWRSFAHDWTWYFGPDSWLLGLTDPVEISESDDGIDYIDPEHDSGKRATRCSVGCRAARWLARPGRPVKIKGLGDLAGDGLWLVESIDRPYKKTDCTVQLVRKTPELPEPEPDSPADYSDVGGSASGNSPGPGQVSDSGWQWPVRGLLTQRFGGDHEGIDIDGETGDPMRPARPGTVTFAGQASGYGGAVYIDHGNGFTTRYGHLSTILVHTGERIGYDDLIGRMGATGNASGSHLHFEIRQGGTPVDPLRYLP